jgi:hypothetical protein
MVKRILLCVAIPFGVFSNAWADFQYQSTSRITGGAMVAMMRFVPGGSALKEPQVSTVAVKGNRMVRRSKRQTEIIDLDRRTITTIDFEKRAYSEMTFDQMKQALEQMSTSARGQQDGAANVNLDVDADIKNTGQTKTINGMVARQVIITMTMGATDPKSGQSGSMKMNSEMWLVKDVAGASEMREFYKRMAKELDWAPTGMSGLMNRPDLARAMAKMMAEGEKMDGTPVEQVLRMTAAGAGLQGDPQTSQQAQSAAGPSLGDALGGALGGRLGALGGFGRKKKQDSNDAPPADGSASAQQADGSLMEMTIDSTGFSTAAVDDSLFAVPSDFKKVDPPTAGRRGR